ncbi:MAG: PIN domain-containing protein [Acidobacteria bacterium]|nr:MAG: PIN domain-containing protein [Acidobacteriota bacterium]
MIAYVDSSVLLRLILRQKGALEEWKRVERGVASALVEVECLRTLDRLRLVGMLGESDLVELRETVYRLTASLEIVELSAPVLARASQPLPTTLGTLDAIHLVTALMWRDELEADLVMATHDHALAQAARACGLEAIG